MIVEELTQDDLFKAFGIDTQNATNEDESNTENEDVADVVPEGSPNPTTDEPGENPENTPAEDKEGENKNNDTIKPDTKAANAFASMRVELAQKDKMLQGIANMLGIDINSKDSMDQLQTKITEATAKKNGVPLELQKRLDQLERSDAERNRDIIRNNAYTGFQKIKDSFGLNDAELQQFATELVQEGKNPFEKPLDLVNEYKLKNFDKLIEKAKNEGIQSEIARSSKANNNASTPSDKTGVDQVSNVDKVNNIKELNEWFNQQKV